MFDDITQKKLGDSASKHTTFDAPDHASYCDSVEIYFDQSLNDNDPVKLHGTAILETWHSSMDSCKTQSASRGDSIESESF